MSVTYVCSHGHRRADKDRELSEFLKAWSPLQVSVCTQAACEQATESPKNVMISDFDCTITALHLYKCLRWSKPQYQIRYGGRDDSSFRKFDAWLEEKFTDKASLDIRDAFKKECSHADEISERLRLAFDEIFALEEPDEICERLSTADDEISKRLSLATDKIISEKLSLATGLSVHIMGGKKRAEAVARWIQSFNCNFCISSRGDKKEIWHFLKALQDALDIKLLDKIMYIHGNDGVLDPRTGLEVTLIGDTRGKMAFAKSLSANMGQSSLGYIDDDDTIMEEAFGLGITCFRELEKEGGGISDAQMLETLEWSSGIDESQQTPNSEQKKLGKVLGLAWRGNGLAQYVFGLGMFHANRPRDGLSWLQRASENKVTQAQTDLLLWSENLIAYAKKRYLAKDLSLATLEAAWASAEKYMSIEESLMMMDFVRTEKEKELHVTVEKYLQNKLSLATLEAVSASAQKYNIGIKGPLTDLLRGGRAKARLVQGMDGFSFVFSLPPNSKELQDFKRWGSADAVRSAAFAAMKDKSKGVVPQLVGYYTLLEEEHCKWRDCTPRFCNHHLLFVAIVAPSNKFIVEVQVKGWSTWTDCCREKCFAAARVQAVKQLKRRTRPGVMNHGNTIKQWAKSLTFYDKRLEYVLKAVVDTATN